MPAPAIMPISMSLSDAMPSSRTRHDSTIVLSCRRSTSVPVASSVAVLIETLSGLRAEVAGVDQLLHLRHHVEAVAERLVQVLGHVQDGVEAQHVGEEERAHRHGARLLDHLVHVLHVEALLVHRLPDLGGRGVEDAVHDEAGRLAAADRLLLDLLGEVVGGLHRLLGRLEALDHLDQAHHRGGVEEVEADDAVGPARGLGHLADRQRAGVRAENRVARRHLVELGEHRLLDVHPLRHGLDHEVDVAEALVLGRPVDAPEDRGGLLLALLLGDLLLLDQLPDLALGDLLGLLEPCVDELLLDVLQHDVDVRGGQHLGDLSTHGSGADHGGFENEHLEFLRRRWGRRRGPLTGAEGYKAACSAASVAKRRSVRASASFWARRMNRRSTSALSGPPTETLYASSSSTTVPSSSSVNVTRWVPSS